MTTSPSTVKTTIIIATHGRPRLLRRTLESIVCCERPPGLDSILVVENGGRGGAEEVCASVDGKIVVRYTYVDEGNKSMALNRGLMEADTEFVCFFDDDVRLGTSTLTDYVGAASRYGPGHFLGGPVLPEFEEVPPQWLEPYLVPSTVGWDRGSEEHSYNKPYFIGSNWAGFRQDFLNVGGFAEYLGPGSSSGAIGDETDIQERMLENGCKGIYLPGPKVWHHVPREESSFEGARSRQYRSAVTRVLMETRHDTTRSWISVPFQLWRRWLVLVSKVFIARSLRWSRERRAYLEMHLSRTRGEIVGHRWATRLAEDRRSRNGPID